MAIRVLVVDDSILFRETLSKELKKDPEIEIVGMAGDPFEARDKIVQLRPDVLTLDVEMPKMDGIEFLRKLMPQYPMPVIVSSTVRESVFDALDAGAVDFVAKPDMKKTGSVEAYGRDMVSKVKIAAKAKLKLQRGNVLERPKPAGYSLNSNSIIAIGASTGGTEAIFNILTKLPADMPGIVMVQHMPPGFTELYAERLNKACALTVREAKNNDPIKKGTALLAPGDMQMSVVKSVGGYSVKVYHGEKVTGHRPSADVLFDSVADVAGRNAIGVILTGMGSDGAKGLLKLRQTGAYTIGQDEASCVVYGMPMVAFKNGAVAKQLNLHKIPQEICNHLAGK